MFGKTSMYLAAGALLLCWLAAAGSAAEPPSSEVVFARHVLPIFKAKCFACHGDDPTDVRGSLDMRSRSRLLQGGDSGQPTVVPGKPDESPLYLAVTRKSDAWSPMPPKDNDALSSEQVGHLRQWIATGAAWPDERRLAELTRQANNQWDAADGVQVPTSGGLSDEWTHRRYKPENLWAYQPPKAVKLDHARGEHPIDALIDARLKQLQLEAAPLADRRTLIRRATFDLIGLPPTPAEIAAFVNDPAEDDEAFARVVDRLLASPHYGEQWGRHWLDVVRYADSSGYANDYERGNAWRYRDYVVRAFNQDKPYDQFIREQIAGDELVEQPVQRGEHSQLSPSEALVAVGFLRMGAWELTGMEVAKVARQRFLDDVTDAVGQVFLAHMLQCARCHDHKFDPVPTRDYYAIQAVFATTQLAERAAPFLPAENTAGFESDKKYLLQRQAHYEQTLQQLARAWNIQAARQWLLDQKRDTGPFDEALTELRHSKLQSEPTVQDVRKLLEQRGVARELIPPQKASLSPREFGLERIARKGLERLKWRMERYEPVALSVYNGRTPNLRSVTAPRRMPQDRLTAGELEQTCILVGGDPFSPASPVEPGVLSAVALKQQAAGEAPSYMPTADGQPAISGRRLALANWIASADNPLTARVMVNRIWQWHVGQAIAGNPNNFGATGKKPTHPQLLDYLAARFIESGWSVKAMHRLIMTSRTYRRASQHPQPKELASKDPTGNSYAVFRPRRLDAEELRDSILFVSGELNPALGGIPVRPEMNLEAALQPRQVMGTFAEAWQPSPRPEDRHRRSLYTLRLRGQRDPFLEVFNAPTPDLSCEAREASMITPQVFALFNSEASYDRALAFANRLMQHRQDGQGGEEQDAQTIQRAFQLAFGRLPSAEETQMCLAHWRHMTERHQALHFDRPTYPRQVVREAVEENTGERFTFEEPLEVYTDFVPDLKPADVGPKVRGLAEVCLVLFNSNEFAYVY